MATSTTTTTQAMITTRAVVTYTVMAIGHDGHDGHDGHGDHVHRGGLIGFLCEIFKPHSHDSTDKIDSALETSREGMRCLKISFLALFVTAVVQTVLVLLTGSVALLGDTVHNYADALTAVPLAIAFLLGRRAATRRYTYGFGRAEDLAGVIVVVVIAASTALTAYAATERLLNPQEVSQVGVVAVAGLVGFIGNEVVARYRIVTGRKIGSAALVADGLHARTDGFTSLAVLVGAAGVALGYPRADPIVGLLITVAILFVLKDAAKEVYRRLMDAVDPELVDQCEAVLRSVNGVEDVNNVRLRWVGHSLEADARIAVDPSTGIVAAHELSDQAEYELVRTVRRLGSAVIHAEPTTDHASATHRRFGSSV